MHNFLPPQDPNLDLIDIDFFGVAFAISVLIELNIVFDSFMAVSALQSVSSLVHVWGKDLSVRVGLVDLRGFGQLAIRLQTSSFIGAVL